MAENKLEDSQLESILRESLVRCYSAIREGDWDVANYWLVEHAKDINKLSSLMSDSYLTKCAERYLIYNEHIQNGLLQ